MPRETPLRVIRVTRTAVLIASALALFIAGYSVVRFDTGLDIPLVSGLFILALALPSYLALLRWLGPAPGLFLLVALSVLPVIVEALAIVTGVPYGEFSYSPDLGYRVFSLVPWTMAFAYLPMLLGSFTAASHLVGNAPLRLIAGSAAFLVLVDLAVDPALVHAGFWEWPGGGLYYGIPAANFFGWFLTGALYSGILYRIAQGRLSTGSPVPAAVAGSLLLILSLWTGYLLWVGFLLPFFIGLVLLLALLYLTAMRPGA
ncbi:hypothetical protein ASZ90_009698 [hydrocarbon metagenome]|uniref:Carotenoid biosynthesis protein n=1 Tax=hydrocarbon metagenome TaxID=938273 RepID=A0A0W8FIF2_9ZZZZ